MRIFLSLVFVFMFVELVCGPPGSGKTTYCEGKRQFLSVYDPTRPVVLFNLDPANDSVFPYPCDVNITELIDHKAAMEEIHLGPNGTYLYCIDFIAENMDWVRDQLTKYTEMRVQEVTEELANQGGGNGGASVRVPYVLIDCPGQVEFYLYSEPMSRLIKMLQKDLHSDVCVVHLADAAVATRDVPTYISTCLLSLSCMVDMELPHVNILTKWDTLTSSQPQQHNDLDVEFSHGGRRRRRPQTKANSTPKHKRGGKLQRDSGLRGPRGEVIMEDLTSSEEDNQHVQRNISDEIDSEELDRIDVAIGDEHEMFLRTSDFFELHMKRLWRMKDRGTLRNLATVPSGNPNAVPVMTDRIRERDTHGEVVSSVVELSAAPPLQSAVRQVHYSETKLYKLSEAIASVIDSYGLVGFEPLDIHDQSMMTKLTQKIDNAMGNLFFA